MAYPATPKTWVAGDVLTAAQLNAELRDALLGAFPLGPPDTAWTAWNPTITQLGAVTKTVTYGKYSRVGRTITFAANLAVTGPGTAANTVTLSLPVASAATDISVGTGHIIDASAATIYNGNCFITAAGVLVIWPSADGNFSSLGARGFVAALASGDSIRVAGTYESAT